MLRYWLSLGFEAEAVMRKRREGRRRVVKVFMLGSVGWDVCSES